MRMPFIDRPVKFSVLVLTALFSPLLASPAHAGWVNASGDSLSLGTTGAAFADVDNDGDLDLFLAGPKHLYRNEGGGFFVDVTSDPLGDTGPPGATAAFGDIDNDGDLDLYLVKWNAWNRLFRNEGGGVFVDATSGPLGDGPYSYGLNCAFGDVDNDGDLDLYLTNAGPNKLFRNEGDGSFVDATSGPLDDPGYGEGVAFADIDDDGDLDLFVANPIEGDKLLRNEGGGVFVDATSPPLSFGSRAVVFGDMDNDGDLDLYLAKWGTNQMLRNEGGGTFADVTNGPLGGWSLGIGTGVAFGDVDNDGDLDLYEEGHDSGMLSSSSNRMLRNEGGELFTDVTDSLLAGHFELNRSDGVAFGDVDNDGDLDLFGDATLFRNDGVASGNHWLHINLVGTVSNRSAIGARVRVVAAGVSQVREVSGGPGDVSQNSLTAEFGLALATVVDMIEIRWPSGIVQDTSDVAADQALTIVEREATAGVGEDRGRPLTFRLHPSIPNPFSRSTVIRFDLPRAAQVAVRIYDIRGRRMQSLTNGNLLPAGRHEISWDGVTDGGRPAPPGIYFYTLEAEGLRSVQRLVRLR